MFCPFVCSIAASTPVEQWTCRSIASQVSISIINVTHICIMHELGASNEFGKQFPFLCNLISFKINFTCAHLCSCNSDRPGSCETTTFLRFSLCQISLRICCVTHTSLLIEIQIFCLQNLYIFSSSINLHMGASILTVQF